MCDSFQWLNISKFESWVKSGGNLPRTRYNASLLTKKNKQIFSWRSNPPHALSSGLFLWSGRHFTANSVGYFTEAGPN